MKELILLKYGEVALKGLNKSVFESMLMKTCRRRVRDLGEFKIYKAQSTMYCEPVSPDADLDGAFDRLCKVFGFAGLARAVVVEKDFDDIKEKAAVYLADELEDARTFKVEAKRSDKSFPMKSPEISAELGGYLLERFPHLKVDVHHPDLVVTVEVRDFAAYVRGAQIPGAGGMPTGSAGRGMLLISGGIDSPVAGYMMARRGMGLSAIHFVSPPYTSEMAKHKVLELVKKMCAYSGRITTLVVPFTHIQEEIRDKCPEEYFTVIMRRYMMKIAQIAAEQMGCEALITGESVGQVASQTVPALACTDIATDLPVFRPLIGMDKDEIVSIARKIDTFETSILPYEDCCTVFTPKHPRTRPKLGAILHAEEALDEKALIEEAAAGMEQITISI
ncbi:tRNA uracil 4-sulfurtransferase ThiI [Zongyangia hominis]|uniref:Probable tRNA sulfurtransferase n=1 Tax=Zongyangia hominis TaxID=2763677 RepID=A0A926IBR3_9FIRM|nr:tRNA uracil 4-sulfurtransferase ThiI [Zongyangia hominis]MBC8570558.1 tRNA 4-thiouridine(8) synthase ThiI [Zongyangia hominis]